MKMRNRWVCFLCNWQKLFRKLPFLTSSKTCHLVLHALYSNLVWIGSNWNGEGKSFLLHLCNKFCSLRLTFLIICLHLCQSAHYCMEHKRRFGKSGLDLLGKWVDPLFTWHNSSEITHYLHQRCSLCLQAVDFIVLELYSIPMLLGNIVPSLCLRTFQTNVARAY